VVVPVLYSSSHDAHSLRVRLAFLYAHLRCEIREIDPENPLPAVATLPLLQLPGRLIDNSLEMTRWALSRRPGLQLWPESRVRRQSIDNLIATVDGPFHEAYQAYEKAGHVPNRSRDHFRMQAEIFLAQLEARIARMGYLVGNEETLADITVLPFIYMFAEVDRDWFDRSPYLALRQWLERYNYNPLWTQCCESIPYWRPGAEPFYLIARDADLIPTLNQRA